MAYAHISGVETDTTSVISPNETRKLLQTKGVIPKGVEARCFSVLQINL